MVSQILKSGALWFAGAAISAAASLKFVLSLLSGN